MVNLGIIGIGPEWESLYRPSIERLGQRAMVRSVYDIVTSRAQAVAASNPSIEVSEGILALADRPDIDAIIALESSWQLQTLLPQLCARRKPTLLAGELNNDVTALELLHETAILTGTPLIPEFRWRYTPSTNRLQELLATRLGPVQEMNLDLEATNGHRSRLLNSAIDWSTFILRARPHAVRVDSASEPGEKISLEFPQGPRSSSDSRVHIRSIPNSDTGETCMRIRIRCDRGTVEIDNFDQLQWQESDQDAVNESLEADRPPVDVLLDHFCRRAVGGLIPIADVRDAYRSLSLLQAIDRCQPPNDRIVLPLQ